MMERDIARTRPIRSPSQPNTTPPVAAPMRNTAMITPNQPSMSAFEAPESSSPSAGRPTSGNIPISKPSNIQPSSAATRAIQRPRAVA